MGALPVFLLLVFAEPVCGLGEQEDDEWPEFL